MDGVEEGTWETREETGRGPREEEQPCQGREERGDLAWHAGRAGTRRSPGEGLPPCLREDREAGTPEEAAPWAPAEPEGRGHGVRAVWGGAHVRSGADRMRRVTATWKEHGVQSDWSHILAPMNLDCGVSMTVLCLSFLFCKMRVLAPPLKKSENRLRSLVRGTQHNMWHVIGASPAA